jgi:3-polyprenyl-4-hydroxybenzoate decarboxylase
LLEISSPVATELEITEIADREMKLPVNGVVSPFPVAINPLGSHQRIGTGSKKIWLAAKNSTRWTWMPIALPGVPLD